MCGIAAIVANERRPSLRDEVAAMVAGLPHRGPDGNGVWEADAAPVALGHCRLAIIDLSSAGAQPMTSVDGRFTITFNGEIYNYLELRQECEQRGSRFVSASDTEVILECHRHFGADACKRFRGMWSYVLHDAHANEVLLCRDPFGIKPLYYALHRGDLLVASEPGALRVAAPELAAIDEVTVHLFEEYGYLDRGDWTFFSGIKRFPAAHHALIRVDREIEAPTPERYWEPPQRLRRIGMTEAGRELLRLLQRSVQLHLRSDVPVGSCLSGGLDSSAIVCLASRELPAEQRLRTFTTHYPNHPEIDESQWAKLVIDETDAVATFEEPRPDLLGAGLADVLKAQGEPFGGTSILAQHTIFRRVGASDVKVVLDGQGADEQLAGYHGYVPQYLEGLARQGRFLRLLRERRALRRTMPGIDLTSVGDLSSALATWREHAKKRAADVAGPAVPAATSQADELEVRLARLRPREDTFEDTLVNLTCDGNLEQLLRYEDRNSMAYSVEARVPFLDPRLAEFVLSLPADLKISRGLTKAVLREALRGVIPEAVRLRTDKLGFPAPETDWLQQVYGLEVSGPGSAAWRELVGREWRQGIAEGTV